MHIGSHWISYMGPGSPISGSRFPLPLVPWSPHVPHPCLHTVPTCWLGQNLHPGCSTMKKPKTYPLHWHAHAETALADGATQNMALLEHVGLAGYPRHQTMHPTAHTLNPTGYPPLPRLLQMEPHRTCCSIWSVCPQQQTSWATCWSQTQVGLGWDEQGGMSRGAVVVAVVVVVVVVD